MMSESKEHERKDNYDIMEQYGYFRPNLKERKLIKKVFESINITIHGNGFDLIDKTTKDYLNQGILQEHIKDITLYELKSTWRKNINSDFKGFSFGITSNELKNNDELGDKFKIIFLNGNTKEIKIQLFDNIGKNYSNTCHFFTIGKINKSLNVKDLIK